MLWYYLYYFLVFYLILRYNNCWEGGYHYFVIKDCEEKPKGQSKINNQGHYTNLWNTETINNKKETEKTQYTNKPRFLMEKVNPDALEE